MAKSQPTNVVDFDFKPEAPKSTSQGMDLSAISFDLGTPAAPAAEGAAVNAGWQEVATKLDLAKAYQEMGDKDGARELLNEVIKEGDAAQQQQAQTMLAALR
jgi:pilus assembly protein FimV